MDIAKHRLHNQCLVGAKSQAGVARSRPGRRGSGARPSLTSHWSRRQQASAALPLLARLTAGVVPLARALTTRYAIITSMSKGRDNKLAGQIGEYLVCAELGKRGLIATPFSGNVPAFDVLAADDLCRTVPIQVKASRNDNWPSDARDWMQISLDPETKAQKNLRSIRSRIQI